MATSPAFAQQISLAGSAAIPTADTVQDAASITDPQSEEEIVVTGVRASIVKGLQNKRESVQVIESVVAEDVGKLPDNNVIEALQRVTGIQVTNRASAEASGISIRGLPDSLTTMNGRRIFTASGQAFALQDIPANLVSRIDVFKTRSADQIETGLAGQIDVRTRRPLDFDGFAISGVARGIYDETADTFNPNVSALISNRWTTGIGEIGILINGSYARSKYREMSVTAGAMVPFATENPPAGTGLTPLQRVFPETGAWQPGLDRGLPDEAGSTFPVNGVTTPYYLARDAVFSPDVTGDRERPAVNAALQWQPTPGQTYTAEFFYAGFRNTTFNSLLFSFVDWWGSLGPNPASTFTLYPDSNIIKTRTIGNPFGFNSGDLSKTRTDSFVYALNADWDWGDNGKIVADLSYQTSEFASTFQAMRLERVASEITVDFNERNGLPAYNFNDNALLLDPSQWTVAQFFDNANGSTGDALTLHLDGWKDFDTGLVRRVKAGIRIDDRGAADSVRTQEAGVLGRRLNTLDPGLQYVNKGFFNGRANVPPAWVNANGYYINENADQIRSLYNSTIGTNLLLSDELSLTKVFDINEITLSVYAQADLEVEIAGRPLQVQLGARYVDVDTDLTFTDRFSGETRSDSQATSAFLPSVTVRFDITDKLRARFNYGETLRRPGFGDLNPFFNLVGDLTGIGRGSGSGGNPNLVSTTSRNYDLGLEWYFERDSAIYGTLFRREIEGLVVPVTNLLNIPGTGLFNPSNNFAVTQPTNASNGVLEGAELGLVYFPKFLPGILDGLGVQSSLTLLRSNQNIPISDGAGNIVGQDESSFFGVSDMSYNVTLAYERGPIGIRTSYVWRENFLANNEARLFANPIGVWRRPEQSLDAQITYSINDKIGITFDAVNLTNQLQQGYYRFDDAGGPDRYNLGSTIIPRTFALGARFVFD
ncbi:TonB-dependent receptor [Sphingomonas sp. FW199]|uniref:TonB-dependent receptor n=1 Tax=Sphingomonas sp. FW199 TaxID=3400217 RepID=UPI003CFB1127